MWGLNEYSISHFSDSIKRAIRYKDRYLRKAYCRLFAQDPDMKTLIDKIEPTQITKYGSQNVREFNQTMSISNEQAILRQSIYNIHALHLQTITLAMKATQTVALLAGTLSVPGEKLI